MQAFLRRFLAFEIQARQSGGLPKECEPPLPTTRTSLRGPGHLLSKSGGRLLREWNGTHVVDVIQGGYRWKGATYRSLSAIARESTGAHWPGPRFFGLKGKRKT